MSFGRFLPTSRTEDVFRKQKQPQKNLSAHEKCSVSTSDIIDSFKQSLKKKLSVIHHASKLSFTSSTSSTLNQNVSADPDLAVRGSWGRVLLLSRVHLGQNAAKVSVRIFCFTLNAEIIHRTSAVLIAPLSGRAAGTALYWINPLICEQLGNSAETISSTCFFFFSLLHSEAASIKFPPTFSGAQ